jgi:cysteine desulfurase/selenocysteine lyase
MNMKDDTDIRKDFPIFASEPDLAYFDSASTSLMPTEGINRVHDFLTHTLVSSRRGAHRLAVRGGAVVEQVRLKIADFLNTTRTQISFQQSIPTAITSLAFGYQWHQNGRNKVVVAQSEDNDVYVSLLRAAQVLGLAFEVIPLHDDGTLDLAAAEHLIDSTTGLVAVGLVQPGTGSRNAIREVARIVHDRNAFLVTDATRALGFTDFHLSNIEADVIVSSANIGLLGPPGLAIQWSSPAIVEKHIPGIVGGSAVADVKTTSFEVALQHDRFESGMINVPAIAGLGGSIEFLQNLGTNLISKRIARLARNMASGLQEIEGLVTYGNADKTRTVFGFNLGSGDPSIVSCHDIALFLDASNIAVRSGLVCAHPLMQRIAPDGLVQASIHFYNSFDDVDRFLTTLNTVNKELV